jgi:23S rRNA (cytosine1962-C5)-methyltransferase
VSFGPVLVPWLDALTIAEQDGLLAVEKPPRVVVHGGDVARGEDLVGRLKRGLAAAGLDDYLGVHQRLDMAASGVLVFTRSKDRNPAVAAAFSAHDVGRVYVAVVAGALPAREGELVHQLLPVKGGATQVVRSGGQRAVARYRVLRRVGPRTLVELRPQTGRTHQLRVQLATSGAPIVGDALYGGAPAPRLMLHAVELVLLGHRFDSPLPETFERCLEGRDGLGSVSHVARLLREAAWLREPLARDCDTYRLVNDEADQLPGVTIDRFGDFATLDVASPEAFERREELAQDLIDLGAHGVYLKVRQRADVRRLSRDEMAPPQPIAGAAAPDELFVHEGETRFAVRLGDGLSTGLFVDQRDNRALIRAMARGRVLNLFAYTGSFTVVAALGDAVTTSVDISGRALEHTRRNLALNGIDPTAHRFVKADVMEWLPRARRAHERYDLVVLDPPSFGSRGGKGAFSMAKSYRTAACGALALLAPGGQLLAVTNHRKTSLPLLRRLLHEAAREAGRAVVKLKDLHAGFDCPAAFTGPVPSKSVLLTVG